MTTTAPPIAFVLLIFTALAGCDDTSGEGELSVSAYGEDFVERGIEAGDMADGWSVRFERFEVVVEDVRVAGIEVVDEGRVDLAQPSDGEGHVLGMALVPRGTHVEPSFRTAGLEMVGSASKGDLTKTFAWRFDEEIAYERCETTTRVTEDAPARFEITVHADHLFYDSLVDEDPALRFQALADADGDDDGEITQAELEVADIGAYDPGSAGEAEDLWAFLSALVRTLGHVDGEGHCHVPHD